MWTNLKTPRTLHIEAFPHKFNEVHGTSINYNIWKKLVPNYLSISLHCPTMWIGIELNLTCCNGSSLWLGKSKGASRSINPKTSALYKPWNSKSYCTCSKGTHSIMFTLMQQKDHLINGELHKHMTRSCNTNYTTRSLFSNITKWLFEQS